MNFQPLTEITRNKVDYIIGETTCPNCKLKKQFELESKRFLTWKNGALIQNVFPRLSTSDREALITGFCDKCWDEIFKNSEE